MLISIDLFPLNNFHFKSHQHEKAASALACKCKTNARWKMQFFYMHNLFLTDTVIEQIHILKPGTSCFGLTHRYIKTSGT